MLLSSFVAPDRAEVIDRLGGTLSRLERARLGWRDRRGEATVRGCSDEDYWKMSNRDLLHPLSEKWLLAPDSSSQRTFRDPAAESRLADLATETFVNGESLSCAQFLDWLCQVHRGASVFAQSRVRSTQVFTTRDSRGVQTGFPDPRDVHRQLSLLSQALREWSDLPAFRALLILVGVLAIHPFADGNGRVARACCNALLSEGTVGKSIPFRMIFEASAGGFEVRLRDAAFNGNWAPIAIYLLNILDLC